MGETDRTRRESRNEPIEEQYISSRSYSEGVSVEKTGRLDSSGSMRDSVVDFNRCGVNSNRL